MTTRQGRVARIEELKRKLAARDGIHAENRSAIQAEIERLENIETLIANGLEDDDGALLLTPDMEIPSYQTSKI